MTEVVHIADAAEREQALDVARSFIVQAPAGSGKTELLIQRTLALLVEVDAPEEIVAITFTRKAAGEMRDRVLDALALAGEDTPPVRDHQRRTWELARAVRRRDERLGWGIMASPGRLRIQTIDALCASLTRQMPLLSGFGAQPESLEDAASLYREAALRLLADLDGGGPTAAAIARVLQHLDNDMASAEMLLADMLERRDQWLRHVVDKSSGRLERSTLEAGLRAIIVDALANLGTLTPHEIETELIALARYAAANLAQTDAASPIVALLDLDALPDASVDALPLWRGVAEMLLTRNGTARKSFDVRVGFPTSKNAAEKARCDRFKDRVKALLGYVEAHPSFLEELHHTRLLPPPTYSEAQWAVIGALVALLPLAVAQLEILFRERGQVDFTAVSQAAVRALGDSDAPTDLALALDYRIRHLLVDEFQDTSQSQYQLLERLTAGWQPDDGRTLFVVGDPMQSIYRFREAEVALYLRARREGIETVALAPLTLRVNFRSQAGIVSWVNASFRRLLPAAEDLASGAVPFAESEAVKAAAHEPAVMVHPSLARDRAGEAERVAELVRAARIDDPAQRIAILVRSRSHLAHIVPALKDVGLRFQAIEIEALGHRPVVQDLHALTRALLHPADRIAWLAVLRAPWCGLTLADLDSLAGFDAAACLWDLVQTTTLVARLAEDGRRRLTRLHDCLQPFVAQRRREPLRRWVEGAWLALGGPAAAADAADLEDAQVFLDVLDDLEEGGDLPDFSALAERMGKLFARPDPGASDVLQVMTIHKAKGLEFDTVILPGLGYKPRGNAARLLAWLERPRAHGDPDLLLAPIRERSEKKDPIYEYLERLDRTKAMHEDCRLLYVATTRAKSRLHLVGHADALDGVPRPKKGSLLDRIWPVVEIDFLRAIESQTASASFEDPPRQRTDGAIRRFAADWVPPVPVAGIAPAAAWLEGAGEPGEVEFSWASETARHVGTIVHRHLQRIAEDGLAGWNAERVHALRDVFSRDLRAFGVPEAELVPAIERVVGGLEGALSDDRARWILSAHGEAHSELRLTGVAGDVLVDIAIDRTFVDADGVRWIIDYKTGMHEGADREGFLDNERERYRAQLERYAALMTQLDARPIRLALYFPLMRGWREWEPGAGRAP